MTETLSVQMQASDWLALLGHQLILSLLSVGGAIATTSDMQRYLVDEHGWLSPAQFSGSVALAQAAPGPNVLFVALLGWNLGLNAGGPGTAWLGMLVALGGILLPSTALTYLSAQWGHRNRHLASVRAFKSGMAPIVIGLLLSTGWTLAAASSAGSASKPLLWLVALASALLIWKTKIHLLVLLAGGAVAGAMGLY